jgi:hypothetical protein
VFDQQTIIIANQNMSRNEAIDTLIHQLKVCRYVDFITATIGCFTTSDFACGMATFMPIAVVDSISRSRI